MPVDEVNRSVDARRETDVRQFLSRAKRLLQKLQIAKVSLEHPLSCSGGSDWGDVDRVASDLSEAAWHLGRRILKDAGPELQLSPTQLEALASMIGHNLIDDYFHSFILEQHEELELWRTGRWEELHEVGKISDEDYQDLRESCPDGNPWHSPPEPGD
jgi:hypothetical protein